MQEAILYERVKPGIVKCTACAHYCHVLKDRVGACGVRKNIDDKLYLLVYEKVAAAHIDPIEKKPLYHFFPNSQIFSIGTVGCPLKCEFCQNYDISQSPKGKDGIIFGNEMKIKDIVNLTLKNNCIGIAYTYNEPGCFLEFALDTAKLAKKHNLKNVFVSDGYESKESFELIKNYIDAINIDLKSFSDDFYKNICGARLQPILDSIKRFHKANIWTELTTLIIPNHNDSEKELKQIAEFIASIDKNIPWHISRFYPMYKMLNTPETPLTTLKKAYEIGKKYLNYVYIGNVIDEKYESTYCPKCKKQVIKRIGYNVENKLKANKCPYCNFEIKGVFE